MPSSHGSGRWQNDRRLRSSPSTVSGHCRCYCYWPAASPSSPARSIRTELPDEPLPVLEDRGAAPAGDAQPQAINAMDAMKAVEISNEPADRARRESRRGNYETWVSVQDSGTGFAPEDTDSLCPKLTPPSRRAWAWACRSAARSSRLTAGGCGRNATKMVEPPLPSTCRARATLQATDPNQPTQNRSYWWSTTMQRRFAAPPSA